MPHDLAGVRLANALALFDEFVAATVKHPDARTLRGLERRFAERLQIQPSYWSQIKGRSRQIGEHLARQFERLSRKPNGWMDAPHHGPPTATEPARVTRASAAAGESSATGLVGGAPADDDERFIVGLVLSFYRRHPQRARTQLLALLGEALAPEALATPEPRAPTHLLPQGRVASATVAPPPAPSPEDESLVLWQSVRRSVAPLKKRR